VTVDYNPGAEKINRAICLADAAGAVGMVVLLRAARDARIALFLCPPEASPKFKAWAEHTAATGQPSIALIGDDDGRQLGAKAWRGFACRMCRWSTHVMVHASGAEPQHYESAILTAEAGARVLIIETSPATAESWRDVLCAIPPRQVLVIWPRNGVHPKPDDRARAH
jgi:hypothetical protein